jgi:hypothetical protein
MAQALAAGSSILAGVGRAATRHIRLTVLVCIVLICGSFAAAALLQMRNDRSHALAQAQVFETGRAADLAAVVASELDRIAAAGAAFADGRAVEGHSDGIRNITVYDGTGRALDTANGRAAVAIPPEAIHARVPCRHRQ